MKKIIILLLILLMCNCGKENSPVDKPFCMVNDPKKDLPWLKSIIELSEHDTTGNYWGWIWAESFNKNDVIFIEMPMGSGGLAGYWFNCDGSSLVFAPNNPPKPSRKNLIYSKIPN